MKKNKMLNVKIDENLHGLLVAEANQLRNGKRKGKSRVVRDALRYYFDRSVGKCGDEVER